MSDSDPYGYDSATDTLRVSRHDLARLLLQFRTELEHARDLRSEYAGATGGEPSMPHRWPRPVGGEWRHMVDYDKSFERLADAVDCGNTRAFDGGNGGPDYRIRCKRTSAYSWPDLPPYEGARLQAVRVRSGSVIGHTAPGSAHYAYYEEPLTRNTYEALCGFSFTRADGVKAIEGEPSCRMCVREVALAAHLGTGLR